MATNIRDVKIRINATKKTAQITNAMDMISRAKLKTSEKAIKGYHPYLKKIEDVIKNIMNNLDESKEIHNLLLDKREIKKVCYVLIATDKGLSGAFNNNLYKKLREEIKNDNLEYVVSPIGLKGYNYARKNKHPIYLNKFIYNKDDVEFNELIPFIRDLIKGYVLHDFDQVKVIYNYYVNSLTQTIECFDLLPIVNDFKEDKINSFYEFDGDIEQMLNMILPIYVENVLYGLILNSKASEHASRQNAMKSATDNAKEIVQKLELKYNRARQQAITLEITDIIGGASVINDK